VVVLSASSTGHDVANLQQTMVIVQTELQITFPSQFKQFLYVARLP
jgi:hypothetical protein